MFRNIWSSLYCKSRKDVDFGKEMAYCGKLIRRFCFLRRSPERFSHHDNLLRTRLQTIVNRHAPLVSCLLCKGKCLIDVRLEECWNELAWILRTLSHHDIPECIDHQVPTIETIQSNGCIHPDGKCSNEVKQLLWELAIALLTSGEYLQLARDIVLSPHLR